MSLTEERIQQFFRPLAELASIYDGKARQLLVPRTIVDELEATAEERVAQTLAASEAERKEKAARREAEKRSRESQARLIAELATSKSAQKVAKISRTRRAVEVFAAGQIKFAETAAEGWADERAARLNPFLDDIRRDDGYRTVPALGRALANLGRLKGKFANLGHAIDRLGTELTLAGAMRPAEFRITPLLLVGEPGLGKTYFARNLAGAIGVDFEVVSAGGAQGAFVLSGTASHWLNAAPGGVLKLLARSASASPVLVVDEVDKMGGDERYPVLPALLDLLEPGTARSYRDECLEIRIDASKLIVILTANDLSLVPDPLKSRVEVLQVPRPDVVQRLSIIRREMSFLRRETRSKVMLAKGAAQALAERDDLDLRKTTRLVRDAFATALRKKKHLARPEIPPAPVTRTMGFAS